MPGEPLDVAGHAVSIGLAERQDRVEERATTPDTVEKAGCAPAHAVNREPRTEGGALSMTERNAGWNGNDRSSRLCGVSVRTVCLTRHSPADKSVIRSGRSRNGSGHRQRGLGRALYYWRETY